MYYLLIDTLHCNLQKQVMTALVPAKEGPSTDIDHDANISRNQTGGCRHEDKIRLLQKDLDMATRQSIELNQGWKTTIEDGLDVAADLQKLVADNFGSNSADADVHEINKTILEHVEARAEILRSCLKADYFQRVMQEPPNGQVIVITDEDDVSWVIV